MLATSKAQHTLTTIARREEALKRGNDYAQQIEEQKKLEKRDAYNPQVRCASPSLNDLRFGF